MPTPDCLRYLIFASLLGVMGLVSSLVTGCAGSRTPVSPATPMVSEPETEPPFSLPQIPSGENDVRQGTIIDSDSVQGAAFIDSRNATVDGPAAILESGTTPANIMAFAVYQHVAHPIPAVPFMVSVDGHYQDVDPVDVDPGEGYYVLYADYNLNRWVISGLVKTTTTRITIPETADVVSPGGFVYTAVVAHNGNAVRVTNVQIGYDAGDGFEQYVLPEVPGMSVGRMCDIELDAAGVPQIAYLTSTALIEQNDATARVARLVGSAWEIQEITSVDNPKYLDFAMGSNGRRALVVLNNFDMFIFLDTGTGDFTVEYSTELGGGIPTIPLDQVGPAITYVNEADNPAGELDTALLVYAVDSGGDMELRFVEADGAAPLTEGSVLGFPTPRTNYVGLTTFANKMAMATVSINGLIESDCAFYNYFAATDSWAPGLVIWDELLLGSGDLEGVMLRELDSGFVVAAFRNEADTEYVFGITDGVAWTSNTNDVIGCSVSPSERALDFECNGDGDVNFPTVYGNYSPMVYFSAIGDLSPFDSAYLSIEQLSCSDVSLAIDAADTQHFAWQRPLDGQLVYVTYDTAEQLSTEVVDNGADGTSQGNGPAPIVADGNTLHIFHLDMSHGQITYSRNVAGVWELEQTPILPTVGLPYILIGAGLLEDTGEIYVSYLDYGDSIWKLLISDANQETWRVVNVTPAVDLPIDPVIVFADDGSAISALYYQLNLITDELGLYFDYSVNVPANRSLEVVTNNIGFAHDPLNLAFNQFNGEWYAATNDYTEEHAYLFHRAIPGTWMGPFTIDQQTTGGGAYLTVEGLGCRNSDGQLSAIVSERADASTTRQFSILTSDPEGISFGAKALINSFDETLFDGDWRVYATSNPDGELAMLLLRHLLADPTIDALMFTQDAGVWSNEVWDSPVTRRTSWLPPGFAIMGNGLPAVTLVERDYSEPLYGRVTMYYPW